MKNIKIGVLGDLHAKDFLSYADYISDRREGEKKEILDFIIESFKDCQHVVFLGDLFHSKNNSSSTNRWVVEFLERFDKKDLYIISGNHDKKGDGSTAIDFLGEIKKENWHIFTRPSSMQVGKLKLDFLPYMLNSELEVENAEEATKHIMKNLDGGDILFTHHNITGTSFNGIKTDMLTGVVLPKEKLEKKYKLIVAGDIHVPQQYGKVLITGSIFSDTINETEKFIWKINENLDIEKIKLPVREIHGIENPSTESLLKLPKNSIIKVIITDKKIDIEKVEKSLSRFDAHLLIEDYHSERKKMKIEEGAFDFSIEALLKLYAKERGIDHQLLLKGLALIS